MPFLNLEWTSNRIQFFGEVDLFSVLSGLLYRNEWSSISGILTYSYTIASVAEKLCTTLMGGAVYDIVSYFANDATIF